MASTQESPDAPIETSAFGLTRAVFKHYPHADCYTNLKTNSTPGTITVTVTGNRQLRRVINMHTHLRAGPPSIHGQDTPHKRLAYYISALQHTHHYLRIHHTGTLTIVMQHTTTNPATDPYFHAITKFAHNLQQVPTLNASVHLHTSPVI